MARKKTTHKDVQYGVTYKAGTKEQRGGLYDEWADAVLAAFQHALGHGRANLDVVVYSEAGARWYGGDDAVTEYREDPESSVFQRFAVKVDDKGMVP